MTVVALLACLSLPWTPILESCGQFSKMREGEREGGDWRLEHRYSFREPYGFCWVQNYVKAFSSDQLQASVTPKQVTPLFLCKLFHLFCFILGKMSTLGITDTQLVVYARDAALFKALFFSGDRANDLSLVKTQEIMRFQYNDGLLFNHVWGNSLRHDSSNLFGIQRHTDLSLCPVNAIEVDVAISSVLSVDLSTGYLFLPLTYAGKIIIKQIANFTLQSRLRNYLRGAQIYDGETLHSFRAGVAITLALSGSQLTDIMEHIGWRHALTESHYLKVAQVHRPGGPSELLSRNMSSAHALVASYSDLNCLTNFTVAFPAGPSP